MAEAWATAFPDLPMGKLDAALTDYRRADRYRIIDAPIPVPDPPLSVRPMADAEVHALWATLFETATAPGVAPEDAAAKNEIARALSADPGNVDALAGRFFWFPETAPPELGDHRWGALELRRSALAHLGRCREADELGAAIQALAPEAASGARRREQGSEGMTCARTTAGVKPPVPPAGPAPPAP
jgi:hypothetical protein